MQGWILYKRKMDELTDKDHGVNRLLSAAADLQIELKVYAPSQLNILVLSGGSSVLLDDKPLTLPDFIIPRLGAETSPHAFALIRHLELQGVYSANSAMAIDLVRDKLRLAQLLAAHRLPTPKTILLNFPVSLSLIERELSFPVVIKTTVGAKGVGVFLCDTANSFQDLMGLLGPGNNRQIIAQEFMASSYGRDLRLLVLGSRIIGCMQRTAKHNFKANYSLGGDVEAFPLTKDIEALALACAKLTNLDIAGIDLLFCPEGYAICEANSSPGFKGMELATGDDIAKQIIDYILTQCQKSVVNRISQANLSDTL